MVDDPTGTRTKGTYYTIEESELKGTTTDALFGLLETLWEILVLVVLILILLRLGDVLFELRQLVMFLATGEVG